MGRTLRHIIQSFHDRRAVKKLLLIVLTMTLLLLAGAVALSLWFGQQTEIVFNSLLQKASRHEQVVISHSRYQRGWFSSVAEISFSVDGIPVSFVALNKIDHGPFPFFRAKKFTPLLAAVDSEITTTAPGLAAFPPVKSSTVIRLAGDTETRMQLASHKITERDLGLHWLGAMLTIAVSADRQRLGAELLVPQLVASYRDSIVSAKTIRLTLNSLEDITGITTGDLSLAIDKINLESIKSNFEMVGVRVSSAVQQDKGQLTADAAWQFQLLSDGKIYIGPGHLAIQARKLDFAAVKKFAQEIGVRAKPAPPSLLSKTLAFAASQAPLAPELEVTKFSVIVSGGEVGGQAKFVLDGGGKRLPPNPLSLLLALRGDLELSIPPALLQQAFAPQIKKDLESFRQRGELSAADQAELGPDTIDRIVDRAAPLYLSKNGLDRWLVEDQGQYKLRVSLRRGQLLINNQPWHGSLSSLP